MIGYITPFDDKLSLYWCMYKYILWLNNTREQIVCQYQVAVIMKPKTTDVTGSNTKEYVIVFED